MWPAVVVVVSFLVAAWGLLIGTPIKANHRGRGPELPRLNEMPTEDTIIADSSLMAAAAAGSNPVADWIRNHVETGGKAFVLPSISNSTDVPGLFKMLTTSSTVAAWVHNIGPELARSLRFKDTSDRRTEIVYIITSGELVEGTSPEDIDPVDLHCGNVALVTTNAKMVKLLLSSHHKSYMVEKVARRYIQHPPLPIRLIEGDRYQEYRCYGESGTRLSRDVAQFVRETRSRRRSRMRK